MLKLFERFTLLLFLGFCGLLCIYAILPIFVPRLQFIPALLHVLRNMSGILLSISGYIAVFFCLVLIRKWKKKWGLNVLMLLCVAVLTQWIAISILPTNEIQRPDSFLLLEEDNLTKDMQGQGIFFLQRNTAWEVENAVIIQTHRIPYMYLYEEFVYDAQGNIGSTTDFFAETESSYPLPMGIASFLEDLMFLSELAIDWRSTLIGMQYLISLLALGILFLSLWFPLRVLPNKVFLSVAGSIIMFRFIVLFVRRTVEGDIGAVLGISSTAPWYLFPALAAVTGSTFLFLGLIIRPRWNDL